LIAFLIKAVGISLSGVMVPGPMTAATLAAGVRRPHAGALIALGHAAVELPLVLIIVNGAGTFLKSNNVAIGIGLAGGAFLLFMGIQLAASLRTETDQTEANEQRHPFMIGVILTGANPCFLLWWATIGLTLAIQAESLGVLAFVLFAIIHWLLDLAWLEALSLASNKGTELLGGKLQRGVLIVCAVALIGFGCNFIYEAGGRLL
jgi:threonine/homoserine/homoserine lactone efflux protein